jgi:hypothetical protein
MSRNPHEPTPETRQLVQLHATVGTPQPVIADIIGIDAKTLRKYYRDELDQSLAKANATIGGALFNKAKSGDTAAMIFWMKTQAGWRETNRQEITGPDGGPIQTEDTGARDKLASLLARLAPAGSAGATDSEAD